MNEQDPIITQLQRDNEDLQSSVRVLQLAVSSLQDAVIQLQNIQLGNP